MGLPLEKWEVEMTQVKRWTEHRLNAAAKPKTVYEYYATGHGTFPIDMLRHDCCWPVSSEDAAKIEWGGHARSVKLRSYREPTIGRWSSFQWPVGIHNL